MKKGSGLKALKVQLLLDVKGQVSLTPHDGRSTCPLRGGKRYWLPSRASSFCQRGFCMPEGERGWVGWESDGKD